jgi:hypothetical protein
MLSLGKIQELVDWEEADSVVSKMTLMDKTAIQIDLLSSTERKNSPAEANTWKCRGY